MILADTSAWVEYDRATGSAADRRLSELIAAEGPVAVTEPVIMEVLAGARGDSREADLDHPTGRTYTFRAAWPGCRGTAWESCCRQEPAGGTAWPRCCRQGDSVGWLLLVAAAGRDSVGALLLFCAQDQLRLGGSVS